MGGCAPPHQLHFRALGCSGCALSLGRATCPGAAALPGAELFSEFPLFLEEATCLGQLRCLGQNFFSEICLLFEDVTCLGQLRCLGRTFSQKSVSLGHLPGAATQPRSYVAR